MQAECSSLKNSKKYIDIYRLKNKQTNNNKARIHGRFETNSVF